MKQVEVTILGQGYLLACPEDGQDQLLAAVALVDREMSAIRDAGKVKARDRIAVLAALNLAYRISDRSAPAGTAKTPSGETRRSTEENVPSSELVNDLIQRLDVAIGDDGHLL